MSQITAAVGATTESSDHYTSLLRGDTADEIAQAFAANMGGELGYVWRCDVDADPPDAVDEIKTAIMQLVDAAYESNDESQ